MDCPAAVSHSSGSWVNSNEHCKTQAHQGELLYSFGTCVSTTASSTLWWWTIFRSDWATLRAVWAGKAACWKGLCLLAVPPGTWTMLGREMRQRTLAWQAVNNEGCFVCAVICGHYLGEYWGLACPFLPSSPHPTGNGALNCGFWQGWGPENNRLHQVLIVRGQNTLEGGLTTLQAKGRWTAGSRPEGKGQNVALWSLV